MSNQIRNKKIRDNAYICLSAILRAKEARLLTAAQIDRMLREREFSAACRVAVEGGYEDMSCMDVNGVNEALARFRAAEVAELGDLVPDSAVLDLFRMKYGYHNAKVLVKSGGDPEKYRELLSDSARFSLEELLEVYRSEEGDGVLPEAYARAIREARNALARTGKAQRIPARRRSGNRRGTDASQFDTAYPDRSGGSSVDLHIILQPLLR